MQTGQRICCADHAYMQQQSGAAELLLHHRGQNEMTVTGIEELSRSRSRVYLDESFAFVLYKGELRLYGIQMGKELEAEAYRQILEELLPKRATLRCMNLLKSRAYSEHQLREKLRGNYPQECIELALDYVKSYHYVDDRRFAEDYIANQQEKKSRRVIEQDLLRKGISKALIEEAFAEQEELGNGPDEVALASRWLAKKNFRPEEADFKERQKMAAFLYRKGIGGETIRKVLSID